METSTPISDPLDTRGDNDRYAVIDRAAALIWERAQEALANGEADRISDKALTDLITASVKLYAERAVSQAMPPRPLHGKSDEVVTPTEALTAVLEILRALHLGPMEQGLWSHRKPRNYHLMDNDQPAEARAEIAARTR